MAEQSTYTIEQMVEGAAVKVVANPAPDAPFFYAQVLPDSASTPEGMRDVATLQVAKFGWSEIPVLIPDSDEPKVLSLTTSHPVSPACLPVEGGGTIFDTATGRRIYPSTKPGFCFPS